MNSLGDTERSKGSACEEINEPLAGWRPQKTSNALPWMVYLSTFVAVCGSKQVGAMLGYSSPTQSAITQDLGLTTAQDSNIFGGCCISKQYLFGSILSIGAMFGAITSGPIADFVGRKWAMTVYSCFCIAGWLGIYFAEGVLSLDLGRLAGGFRMGAFSYVVPVHIAEIAPMEFRGVLTSFNQAKKGKEEEFKESLQKLRPKNADISREATEIQDYIQELQRLPKTYILELFQRRYLQSVIVKNRSWVDGLP